MKRVLLVALFVVAGAGAIGATAWARGRLGHGARANFIQRLVAARIDDALDAAAVTPEQRQAIHGQRDRLLATVMDSRAERRGELQRASALFEADRIDEEGVAELRRRGDEARQKLGDLVTQSLLETHALLTPPQRAALVDYVRAHRPSLGAHQGRFMRRLVGSYLDDALDAAGANPAQRKRVFAAAERAHEAFQESRQGGPALLERALALFAAERIDPAAVAGLRQELEGRRAQAQSAVETAVREVHATLSSTQRRAAVAHLRAEIGRHHGERGE